MGIMNIFRKKVQEDVKKKEKELGKKYHGKYSREDLRKMAAQSVMKKMLLKGTILATCAIAGVSALDMANKDNKVVEENSIHETSDLINNDDIIKEDELTTKIDNISTSEQALNYIKEMYAEEYNKANGTNLTVDDIAFFSSNQDYVYDLDGIYITHGATPNDVKNKLENKNVNYEIKDDVKVYTAYKKDEGNKVALESFAVGDSMIVDVILGYEYINGEEINVEQENVLANMSSVIINGCELSIAIKNGNREDDITIKKYNLEKATEKYNKSHVKENVEIDVIGG